MSDKKSDAEAPDVETAEQEASSHAIAAEDVVDDAETSDDVGPTGDMDVGEEEDGDEKSANPVVPLVIGGAIAAMLGAGASFAIMSQMPPPAPVIDETRLEALEEALAAIQNTPAPVVDLSEFEGMTGRVDALEEAIAGLDAQLAEIAALGASGESGSASAAVVAQLSEMQASLESQRAENEAVQAELEKIAREAEAKVTQAEARIDDAQNAAAEREALAAERAALARRQALLSQMVAAVETGAPFDGLLSELAEIGVDLPDGLDLVASEGVPTLQVLQNGYGEVARDGLAESLKVTMGSGVGERFTAFLRAQVGARSLEPREGDDPDAILSRAEAALKTGQLGPVLTELSTLPAEGQAAMQSWIDQVVARQTALDAISALSDALTES